MFSRPTANSRIFCELNTLPRDGPIFQIETLSDGKRRYVEAKKTMTTVDVPPAKIHEIGLKEVERITAEMTTIGPEQWIQGSRELPRRDR